MGILRREKNEFLEVLDLIIRVVTENIFPYIYREFELFDESGGDLSAKYSLAERIILFLDSISRTDDFMEIISKHKCDGYDIFGHIFNFIIARINIHDPNELQEIEKITTFIGVELIVYRLFQLILSARTGEIRREFSKKIMIQRSINSSTQ